MDAKEIVKLILFLMSIPLLVSVIQWMIVSTNNPSPDMIERGVELSVESAIPWWVKSIEWLAGLGKLGAFLIVGFVLVLKWVGEI